MRYGLRKGELKGSIKWLLKRRGIEVTSPFSAEGRGTLRNLRLREIGIRLDELKLVESIIERLDAEIDSIVTRDPKAKLLDTLPRVEKWIPFCSIGQAQFLKRVRLEFLERTSFQIPYLGEFLGRIGNH